MNELSKQIHENNKAKGFYDGEKNIGEMLALIHSEVSEALEADRKDNYMIPRNPNTRVEKNTTEEWLETLDYSDYEVSSLGNVRSLNMKVWSGKVFYEKKGKTLSAGLSGTGYLTISPKGKTKKVHQLVAEKFVEGWFEGAVVNHINGVKTDNFSNNLEWITVSENNKHAIATGLRVPYSILTKWEMCEIAALYKYGEVSVDDIHKKFPQISKSRIKSISYNSSQYLSVFEFELADIIIRCLDMVGFKGIGIDSHVAAKIRYNKMRPHKHGKKY